MKHKKKKAKSWQLHASAALRRAVAERHTACLLQLPPGTGKTLVAVRLFAALRKAGYRMIVAVPSRRLIVSGSWIEELSHIYPELLDADAKTARDGRLTKHVYCVTHRQLSRSLSGRGPRTLRQWIRRRRKVLIVIDEIHRARRLRLDLADAFWTPDDAQLPLYLRRRPGPKSSTFLWLLLSATPYNPVKLDYDIDRFGHETAPEAEDVEQEANILADEVKSTLGTLAFLDSQDAKRDRLGEYVAHLRNALRNSDAIPPRQTTVPVVPSSTRHLRPRRCSSHKPARIAVDLRDSTLSLWKIHQKLSVAAQRGLHIATAERLILGGVRSSSQSKRRLCGHVYSASTAKAVRMAQLPRSMNLMLPKLASVGRLVSDLTRRYAAKVLIFCVHRATASAVSQYLQSQVRAEDAVYDATSASSDAELDLKRKAFNKKGKMPYVLVATDVLSESIGLHQARPALIHFELPWSPLRVIQRVGRVWRIRGERQTRVSPAPTVYHVVHPASVEEEILNRLNRRWGYLKALGLDYMGPSDAIGTRVPAIPWS